jgi:hypothetical protein
VSGSACVLSAGCPLAGTPYTVSIRTPSPSCIDCADHPELAVQVTVRNPSFGLTFSRLLGQSQWNVAASSVAAIDHARSYGLVTLRPPLPRNNCSNSTNCDLNDNTINVTSNVSGSCPGGNVTIVDGDIGTNSNMTVSNNARVCLDPNSDHRVFYYDPYQKWTSPPPGFGIQTLIQDPLSAWSFPARTGAQTYSNRSAAVDTTNCTIPQGGAGSAQAKVPSTYKVGVISISDPAFTTLTCLKPGVYSYSETLAGGSGNTNAYLLEPGVYWFDYGLAVGGTMIGGYEPGQPGVALVFNESKNDCPNNQCSFDANQSVLITLNYGSAYQNASGTFAKAAQDPSPAHNNIETPGTSPVLISLLVARDRSGHCFVQDPEPSLCASSENGNYDHTLNLPGGGNLFTAGVQYAPNDNITVSGNTASAGEIGELISWTITYTGNSTLNFHAAFAERSGVLRLDRACSPGESVCNP